MASAINKKTGQFIHRGIGYADPNYTENPDWIVNPTPEEKEQYKYVPPAPTEAELALAELKRMDLEEMPRVIDDILEYILNGIPIPQPAIDKLNNRKTLRTKLKWELFLQ